MTKKVSCMVAFVCNPYLAVLQKETFKKYWRDEVDEVLVNINGGNRAMRDFILKLWEDDPKVTVTTTLSWQSRQGMAFNLMYPECHGQVLMTIDSDCFIYKKGIVTNLVQAILDGKTDACGSCGNHLHPWSVAEQAVRKYGTVRLNPFLAFFRKSIIDQIPEDKLNFRSYSFKKDDVVNGIGKVDIDGYMDVMSKFSLDFLSIAPKGFTRINETQPGQYIHFSGMSSLFRRYFRTLENSNTQVYEAKVEDNVPQPPSYWIKYYLLYEATKDLVPFPEYNLQYEKAFTAELNHASIPLQDIKEGASRFKEVHGGLFL